MVLGLPGHEQNKNKEKRLVGFTEGPPSRYILFSLCFFSVNGRESPRTVVRQPQEAPNFFLSEKKLRPG